MARRRGGDKADHDREVNNYRVLKKVGEGSFGSVYKVVSVYTDAVYAMKVCVGIGFHSGLLRAFFMRCTCIINMLAPEVTKEFNLCPTFRGLVII